MEEVEEVLPPLENLRIETEEYLYNGTVLKLLDPEDDD